MTVRATMAALIARVRILINDTSGSPIFTDQAIQDVLDESRVDAINQCLNATPTYLTGIISYLDYYSDLGGWEDGYVLKQYLTLVVTPSVMEPIVGHFAFAASTLPPVYITGAMHDVYRASADLLERLAAQWALSYNVNADGQSFQRSQVLPALLKLAESHRKKQRAHAIAFTRSDTRIQPASNGLGATPLDYMASGNPGGG